MSALTSRGSTTRWRRLRTWWAQQLPLPCARCGLPVRPDDDWHLDHLVPRSIGGGDETARPSHARCNLSAGGVKRGGWR
jgi:5-methylcytosine-specific restriction endonuclease McrA